MMKINAINAVIKPKNTLARMTQPHTKQAILFFHTAFMLDKTAVAKSTLRSNKIGCVNALMKNTATENTAPTMVPNARKGQILEKDGSK